MIPSTQLPGAPLSPPLNLLLSTPHPHPHPQSLTLSLSYSLSLTSQTATAVNVKAPAVPNAYAPNASPKVHSTHKKR